MKDVGLIAQVSRFHRFSLFTRKMLSTAEFYVNLWIFWRPVKFEKNQNRLKTLLKFSAFRVLWKILDWEKAVMGKIPSKKVIDFLMPNAIKLYKNGDDLKKSAQKIWEMIQFISPTTSYYFGVYIPYYLIYLRVFIPYYHYY